MKKILLILSALLLTAVGASAQITDVTEQYIKNASFEESDTTKLTADENRGYQREEDGAYTGAYTITADDLLDTGWTLTGSPSIADIMTVDAKETDNNFGLPGAPSDGDLMLYLRNAWATMTSSITQEITLTAGTYMVTVDSKCISTSGSTATLIAGEKSVALTINSIVPEGWDTATLTFTLEEETTLSLGVSISFAVESSSNSNGSFLLDNFKLYSINYEYNITSLLANPSFENVDVTELTVDGTRCNPEVGGAWTVTSLEGWDLVAPDNQWSIHDIMTADATATDNDFGAPGIPSNGTYMLYMRDGNSTVNGSVEQTLTLPAGDYKLTVDTKCVTTSNSTGALVAKAGDETIESVAVVLHTSYVIDEESLGWDTAVLMFTLTETTEITIGVDISFDGNGSFLLDNFQLFSTEEVEAINFDYDVTWMIANPSFEVDNVVADLEADGGRGNSVTTLTGWDLSLSEVDHCDLMTKDATETDNNLGVPSVAADGTYWLYLKKSWGNNAGSASVKQKATLPAGDYKLTVHSMAVATSATAKLVAGEESTAITINATAASTDLLKTMEWTTNDLVFTVEAEEGKETEVELGVDFTFPTGAGVGSILIDNFKLYSVEAITKEISWTMTDAGWGTLILPFTPTSNPSELTLYDGDALTIEGSTITVGDASESIIANTPYLVKGAAGTYTFSGTPMNEGEIHTTGVLTGTLVDLAVGKGAAFATDGTQYLLQNHDGEVAFYPIILISDESDETEDSSEATLDAYHCYLSIATEETDDEGEPTKLSIVLPGAGEETGIVAVEGDNVIADGAIYDLSGRRVAKAVKGVYIQNGKKVLVK